ncbi:hypothetical protein DPEC_G00169760 [Dallia pectoralis]|uniref:Uncharacterized protein n=1 Tax=Dallia pectoralis TaxID=75939 RepID=A0ACC2GD74_DALPE|nr:hypothetical protein DPEC_G00169760 [Dallia pectoralis]
MHFLSVLRLSSNLHMTDDGRRVGHGDRQRDGAVGFGRTPGGPARPYPPVFVVDSQANFTPVPLRRRWGSVSQRPLHLLVVLAIVGMLIEAGCIMHLYNRTQVPTTAAQPAAQLSAGTPQGLTGFVETNEIPAELRTPHTPEQKPSAHLIGPEIAVAADNVVSWLNTKPSLHEFRHEMDIKNNSRLVVLRGGYYYVYSKVHFVEDCSLFQHHIMHLTERYPRPMVLMKANRYHCPSQKSRQQDNSPQNIVNSYLGGVFSLSAGDQLYVTVQNRTLLKLGSEENFMGAFMI